MSLLFWKTNRRLKNESRKTVLLTGPLWGLGMERWGRTNEKGETERRGGRCLGKLGSRRSVYLFKREFSSGSKTKWGIMGDQKRPSDTPPAVLLRSPRPLHLSPVSMNIPFTPRGPVGTMGLCASRIHWPNAQTPSVSFLKGHNLSKVYCLLETASSGS